MPQEPWDSAVIEQRVAAFTTPSLHKVHMGIAGPHNMGTSSFDRY